MEVVLIARALHSTTNLSDHTEATNYLNECSSMIGFPLILLDILGNADYDSAVRQAAVIYLKNLTSRAWDVAEDDAQRVSQISEQDKVAIRSQIVSRIVNTPEPIRIQLCVCVQHMLRLDYPEKFNVIDEVFWLLNSDDVNNTYSALLVIHRLTKVYEYKRNSDKAPFIVAMQRLLPALYERFKHLQADLSQESCRLQKMIMKIFYCTIQFSLSKELLTAEGFGHWLELLLVVVERPVPAEVADYDDPEETVYWKCKKWALKIIERVFEKYGSKGHVEAVYEEFAEYYTKHYAEPVVTRVMHLLHQHTQGVCVTPRVLSICLSHLAETLTHAQIWKLVKDGALSLFMSLLFPLMRFTQEDEEMWKDDVEAYLVDKADCFEELRHPSAAAVQLIRVMARRKGVMLPLLEFCFGKLQDEKADPRDVDGALNTIGALGELLCSDKRYKNEVERLLYLHVRPRLNSNVNFVRARAFQVIRETSEAKFKQRDFLSEIANVITQRLHSSDEELPVRFEAAMALQALITNQEDFQSYLKPHIGELLIALLRLMTETRVDELPAVVETIIETFEEDVIPIAEQVVRQLVTLVERSALVGENEEESGDDNDGITTMGLMSNLQTVLYLVDDHPEIVAKVEPIVRHLIMRVFDAYAGDYFEDCLNMTEYLINARVGPEMWQVYDKFEDVFAEEGSIFFHDAMACYHKFVIKDTEAFLSNTERPRKLLLTCGKVLEDSDAGDDIRINAAKLLEILLLQCQGRLDDYCDDITGLIWNYFAHADEAFTTMTSQLAVTLIAAFVYNPQRFVARVSTLGPHQEQNLEWLYARIYANMQHLDGQHDRTMVLFFFFMGIRFPKDARPQVLVKQPVETMLSILQLLGDINRCRQIIAQNGDSDTEDEDSDDEDINDSKRNIEPDLADSDDDIEASKDHLEYLQHLENATDSDDSEGRHSFVECTDMEEYETPFDGENPRINIYTEFVGLLHELQRTEPDYYQASLKLPEDKQKSFEEIMTLCQREQERERSNALEKSGGYAFDASAEIPMQFSFS